MYFINEISTFQTKYVFIVIKKKNKTKKGNTNVRILENKKIFSFIN